MKLNDAVFGAVFLALSLLVFWSIQSYPNIPGQNVGPSAFPGAIAVGLAVCSLLLIRNGWRERAHSPWFERGQWTRQPRQVIAFAVTFGALLLYVVASERIGFPDHRHRDVDRDDAGAARAHRAGGCWWRSLRRW